jgi:CRP/FNR family cyclic AMP-dependent transcriptional regulator
VDVRQRAARLRACALFADLDEADLERLAEVARPRCYGRQQIVFAEGDTADALLVVCAGSLKATSSSLHGEQFTLVVVGPGEALGELTLADGGPRSATVTALGDVVALRLAHEDVLRVAADSPALVRALLASLARVVRRLTGDAADLVFLDVPRRVAKLLLALPAPGGTCLTQTDMADRVGASRQSLNAALQDFQRRGWITVARTGIGVQDPVAMRRFVGG